MDYDKLHKDTIAKLQEMVNSGKITVEIARGICADFIPESEDKRIMEALIRYHKSTIDLDGIKGNDILNWLGGQGEHQKFRDSIQIGDKVTRNEDGVLVNLSQLNRVAKKEEQEPADILSVPSKYLIHNVWFLGNLCRMLTKEGHNVENVTELEYIQKHWKEGDYYLKYKAEQESHGNQLTVEEAPTYTKKDIADAYLKGLEDAKSTEIKTDPCIDCDDRAANCHNFPCDRKKKFDEQKIAEKVEPKFHDGDWIIHHGTENIYQVVAVIDNQYQLKYGDNYTVQKCADVDRCVRLYDITKDAKDGDVLATDDWVFIFKKLNTDGKPVCYCHYDIELGFHIDVNTYISTGSYIRPATKEQRDTLEKAMADAGYTFDFVKKKLKKNEQKSAECKQETKPNGGIVYEDFSDGDGYYKMNLAYLSKSQVELIENIVASWQNPANNAAAWSEEDETLLDALIRRFEGENIHVSPHLAVECLKSLKDRVQPQPKQEWSEEDEKILDTIIAEGYLKPSEIQWLKSLSPKSQWNPSDEQMEYLHKYAEQNNYTGAVLTLLYNDLKKLI